MRDYPQDFISFGHPSIVIACNLPLKGPEISYIACVSPCIILSVLLHPLS